MKSWRFLPHRLVPLVVGCKGSGGATVSVVSVWGAGGLCSKITNLSWLSFFGPHKLPMIDRNQPFTTFGYCEKENKTGDACCGSDDCCCCFGPVGGSGIMIFLFLSCSLMKGHDHDGCSCCCCLGVIGCSCCCCLGVIGCSCCMLSSTYRSTIK